MKENRSEFKHKTFTLAFWVTALRCDWLSARAAHTPGWSETTEGGAGRVGGEGCGRGWGGLAEDGNRFRRGGGDHEVTAEY